MLTKLIRLLKKDPNYLIESEYTTREYCLILFYRLRQLLRGVFAKVCFLQSEGATFIGRGVKVRYKHLFKAGQNLILGDYVLVDSLSINGIVLGDNVTIERNSILLCTGVISRKGMGIKVGSNTGINSNAFIGGQGGVSIGNYVIIGPGVKIFSENHKYNGSEYIKNQGEERHPVHIGDDCWIGSGVTILAGVTLGRKTVVASGAVVTKSFDGNCVIGGVPAKILKTLQ